MAPGMIVIHPHSITLIYWQLWIIISDSFPQGWLFWKGSGIMVDSIFCPNLRGRGGAFLRIIVAD